MALINCPECGKEISDWAQKCPHCGYPLIPDVEFYYEDTEKKKKGFWSTVRLIISIISFVLSIFIIYQGYLLLIAETLLGKDGLNSASGIFSALFMIIAAIVGLCTRNRRGFGPFMASMLYFFSYIITLAGDREEYQDLKIWGMVYCIFALFFLICAFAKNKKTVVDRSKTGNIIFAFYNIISAHGVMFFLALGMIVFLVVSGISLIFNGMGGL